MCDIELGATSSGFGLEAPAFMHPGDKFSYTFTKPGTYDYWCTIHPEMLGKVIVK